MLPAKTFSIQTERLLIRCYTAADAPLLHNAIAANLAHLHEWIAWIIREPLSFEEREEQIERWQKQFLQGQDFTYGIFSPDEKQFIGSVVLHARVGPGVREIGYWIGKDCLRRGYATEAVRALVRTGFLIENLARLEIHCSEKNLPSMAIPERLGFQRRTPQRSGVAGDDTVIWAMTLSEFSYIPYRYFKITAFDEQGSVLPFMD